MALNFPTQGLYNGLTYTGDNGITYTYQDGKWIGTGAVSSTISDHLHHGSYNLTLNADGTVQFPNYKFPVADGTANQVLKTDGSGVLTWDSHVGPSIGDMVFTGNTMNDVNGIIVQNYGPGQAATAAVILPTHGNQNSPVEINNTTANVRIGVGPSIVNQWTFGTDSKLTIPGYLITPYGEIRQSSIGDSGMAIDALPSQGITVSSNGLAHKWHFAANGNLTLPTGGAVNYANGHSILEGIDAYTLPTANASTLGGVKIGSGLNIDNNGVLTVSGGANTGNFTFVEDVMNMPLVAKLNSGGVGYPNSAEFGTNVTASTSQAYVKAGDGELLINMDDELRTTVQVGVANAEVGQFAGLIARDPFSQVCLDGINFIQDPVYSVSVGVMNQYQDVNGLFADENVTLIQNGNGHQWDFKSDGDLAVPGEVRNKQGYRAVWENEIPGDVAQLVAMLQNMNTSAPDVNWDGGAAATLYDRNTNADGGYSSTRWGRNTTIFDGGAGTGSSYTMTLNGGGA